MRAGGIPGLAVPSRPGWIHEIKHDGFRILAQFNAGGVRLINRKGFDLAERFPLSAAAIAALPVRSCVVNGEAIAVEENGLSVFDLIRYRRQDHAVTLCAFDLLELDGADLRGEPIEVRKRTLSRLLRREHPGIAFSRHFDVEGAIIYRHACALGCEGIVSKRLGSPYRSGRCDHWLKIKNPAAPAQLRPQRAVEQVQHAAELAGVARDAQPEREGHGEHPLPVRRRGQHPLHQPRRGVVHAPRAAARNCTSGSTVSSPAGHSGPPRPSRAP
jgi:hypothetical protein